jgi:murein DD-endopeptidase MepM/ murein hydrolase activator NlpD
MKWAQRQRTKTLLIALVFLATLGIFLWWLSRRQSYRSVITLSPPSASQPSPFATSPPSISVSPSSAVSPAATPSAANTNAPSSATPTAGLIIPVAGVSSAQLLDTFSAARGEGRLHDAIDIGAPKGTPVLAVAAGKIIRLFQSKAGGTTIYHLSADEKYIYYYAHLDRYADDLYEGRFVVQGETIAYVGDTGNAGAGNYHLHFSVAMTSNPKRWWEGVNINPYPLLRK